MKKTQLVQITCLFLLVGALNIQANIFKTDTTTMNAIGSPWDWTTATAGGGSGVAASSGFVGEFDGTASSIHLANMTLGGNVTLGGLQLDSTVLGPLTISAANTLTLDASLTTNGISIASGSKDVTIGSSLTLAGHQAWSVGSGRTLTVSGTLTTAGAWVDFSTFAGTAAGSSLTTLVNNIYGPWATYGTGTSLRYATESGGVVNAYSGGTAAASVANVTDTTGAVNYDLATVGALAGPPSFNTLRYTGAAGTLAGNFTANGLLNAGTGLLTVSGVETIGANKELDIAANSQGVTLSGAIANNGGGASALTINADPAATLTLSANNSSYSGNLTINGGTVVCPTATASAYTGATSALGNSANQSRTVTVNNGATLKFTTGNIMGKPKNGANGNATPTPVVVNGGTLWATTGGNLIGLLTLNGGTVKSTASPPAGKYQGNSFGNATGNYNHAYLSIQLGSNVTVSGTSPSTISGNGTAFTTSQDGISLNGSSTTFTVSNITGDASVSVPDLTIVAAIGDNNADCTPLVSGALVKAGTGMLLLSGLNFYSGGTTVSAGTLVAGTADNQTLPAAGSPMTTAAANAAGAFGRPGTTLTLGDANTTANNSSPTVLIGGAYNVGHPITVANQATTGTYTIGGGADTNAAFTNLITINQPLTISQVANAGANALTISGGITAASGTPMVTFAGPGNINKTTAAIANGSGTVAVSVTGGTNTFSIANTYTGGTTLNGGTLIGPANLGTGGVNFGGGTLQWPASSTADISGQTVTINSGGATLDVNGNTVTLANAIGNGGSGGLTVKSTATNGVLNLSASPTYMGNTTVSSGTLNINSTLANGNVTVANGAAFGGTGSVTHNVTWQSGALASLTQGSALAVSGTVTLNGNLVLVKAGSALTTGTYTLLTTTGGFTGGSTINPYPATGSAIASGYAGTLAISGGSIVLTVNPATTATWSDANHAIDDNWSDAGNWSGGVPQFAGDVATFGSGGPTNPVVLNANESVGSLTFFNPTSYTISGSHTLTLDNRNQGVAITVIAGTANTLASPVALNDNVTATVSATDALTISGTVSNAPSVTKTLTVNGAGTTILPNANTYGPASSGSTGTTLSGGGTLQVGNNASLGSGDVSVTGSGTLQSGTAGLNVGNKVVVAGSQTATVDNNGNTFTLSGAVSGSGNLAEVGTGTLSLSATNTYGGTTTIPASGTLKITGAGQLGGGSYAGNIANSGTLDYHSSQPQTLSGVISLGGTFIEDGAGTLTLSGVNTYTGNTTINAGNLILGGAGQLNNGSYAGNLNNAGTFTYGSSAAQTLSGIISGAGALTQTGAGTLTLTGPNTYSGVTTLNAGIANAGIAENAGVSGPFGVPATLANSIVFGGGTLQYSAANQNDYSARFSTAANQPVKIDTGGQLVAFATALTSSGTTLTKSGTGSLVLTTVNNAPGGVTISGGALQLNNANAVSNSTVTVSSANGLTFNSGIGTFNIGALAGGSGEQLDDSNSAPVTLVVGANGGATTTYSGALSDAAGSGGGLTLSGGNLTLSATEAYHGPTVVNGGILGLDAGNNPNSGLYMSSGLTISNGGTVRIDFDNSLAGSTSTLGSCPVTVNAGGLFTGTAANYTPNNGGGTSSHIRGVLTLNGGTLANGGTGGGTYIAKWGSWNLDDGVAVNGGTNTSTISALSVMLTQPTATTFNVANGGTPSGIDLNVTGTLIATSGGSGAPTITALVKAGNGTMSLSGANTYTTTTTVSAGTLLAGANAPNGSAGAFGNATSAITLGDANTTANNSSPSLLINGAFEVDRPVTVASQSTTGTYTIGGSTNTNALFTGAITINEPLTISQAANSLGNALTLSGGITSGGELQPVTFGGPGNVAVNSAISDGSGQVAVNVTGGTVNFSAGNSYTGNTTINAGTLALSGGGSLTSPNIVVCGGAIFDVSGTGGFTLSSQTLSNSTSTATLAGNISTAAGTVSLTYAASTPAFTVTNGTLTLSSTTTFNVNNTGAALALGGYKLISTNLNGSGMIAVSDSLPASVVVGGGIAGGASASLQIINGELYLVVGSAGPSGPGYLTNSISGNTLSLSWPAGQGWKLQVQTNSLSAGLGTNWSYILGSENLSGTNITVDPTVPAEFFRLVYP